MKTSPLSARINILPKLAGEKDAGMHHYLPKNLSMFLFPSDMVPDNRGFENP